MSEGGHKDQQRGAQTLTSDLDACFRYFPQETASVLSGRQTPKKRSGGGKAPDRRQSKAPGALIDLSSEATCGQSRGPPRFPGDTLRSEDSDFHSGFYSNVTALTHDKEVSAFQLVRKLNFGAQDTYKITNSIQVSREAAMAREREEQPPGGYRMRRINRRLEERAGPADPRATVNESLAQNLRLIRKGIFKFKSK